MKTTQELRLNCDLDHKDYVRGKRTKSWLPNTWDDLPRDYREHNWKKCTKRKKQYKMKGFENGSSLA